MSTHSIETFDDLISLFNGSVMAAYKSLYRYVFYGEVPQGMEGYDWQAFVCKWHVAAISQAFAMNELTAALLRLKS